MAPTTEVENKVNEAVEGQAPTTNEDGQTEEEVAATSEIACTITIHLPAPTHQSTYLPVPSPEDDPKSSKSSSSSPKTTLTINASTLEILQEIRAQVQDSPLGYWLGPFSFRLPVVEGGRKKGELVNKGREGLEIKVGEKLSDFIEVGEIFGGEGREKEDKVLEVVREPFSEADARLQVLKLREYLNTGSDAQLATDFAVSQGASMYEQIRDGLVSSEEKVKAPQSNGAASSKGAKNGKKSNTRSAPAQTPSATTSRSKLVPNEVPLFSEFKDDHWVSTSLADFHPRASENVTPAACVKSIGVSPWNPPPAQYRSKGHLLYLTLTTLEGESVQLTCTVRGWHVNKSTTVSFDPSPRPSPKDHSCHSLIDLLHGLSPAFTEAFVKLVVGDPNNPSPAAVRDVLAISPMQQAIAASPWLANALPAIASDSLRQQSAFLHTGAVGSDGLAGARDWNDEIQQSREMPRESMQDRVVREKNLARTQAEFTATCVKGALAVARGDVQPLNPHEPSASHMWLHNNIFYTKGVDSIDSFSHLGSDEAAHVACGKDAAGIKALNQQDVEGACLLGHTVVDWAGERWVCQSFLPGIFQRREPAVEEGEEKDAEPKTNGHPDSTTAAADKPKPASDNNLIVYGSDAEAGPNVVRWTAPFHSLMKKVADGFRLAEHEVKAGENGETVKVWSSVEVKGLVGTDGRKYILDAFRLAPVDVEFLEKDMDGRAYAGENVAHRTGGPAKEGDDKSAEGKEVGRYPHRLVLLRPELINLFWESEFRKWAHEIASKRQKETVASSSSSTETATSSPEPAKEEEDGDKDPKPEGEGEEKKPEDKEEAEKPEEEQERIVVQVNGDIHVQKPNGEISITPASDDSQSFSLRFNPDAFVEQKPHVPEGKSISDFSVYEPSQITDESDPTVKAVRDASVFLREAAVPAFLADVLTGRESVQDGSVLTKTMHKKGINMRYLGIIAANNDRVLAADQTSDAIGQLNALQVIVYQEMVFRAAKRILRSLVKGLLSDEHPAVVSHFLNCLVGADFEASPKPVHTPSPFISDSPSSWTELTPESLRAQIESEVASRYRYVLPAEYLVKGLKKKQIVRELALRFGFQLASREYQFEAPSSSSTSPEETPAAPTVNGSSEKKVAGGKKAKTAGRQGRSTTFQPEDVLALVPMIKDAEPSSVTAEETMDAGQLTIRRGDKQGGLDLMLEAVSLYETIHALFHKDVARAYNSYAVAVHSIYRFALNEKQVQLQAKGDEVTEEDKQAPVEFAQELQQALRFQRQAVIIAERTLGLDHPETLGYYVTLAMLEHISDDVEMSLKMFRHCITLWDLIYGPDHPDQSILLTNIGHLLSMTGQFEPSGYVFRSLVANANHIFGPNSIQTANSHHALCQTLFCTGDLDGALEHAELGASIFVNRLGKEDDLSKEAEQLAEAFKNAKAQQVMQQQQQHQIRAGAGGGPAAPSQQNALPPAQQRRLIQQRAQAQAEAQQQQQAQAEAQAAAPPGLTAATRSARRMLTSSQMAARAQATKEAEEKAKADSTIGVNGHLDVDDLVKFVTGSKKQPKALKKKRAA